MVDLENPRTFDDELLETAVACQIGRTSDDPILIAWYAKVDAEAARRAEVRLNRMQAAHWGPNRFDDTEANILQKHDASWYESRQWLTEMGA